MAQNFNPESLIHISAKQVLKQYELPTECIESLIMTHSAYVPLIKWIEDSGSLYCMFVHGVFSSYEKAKHFVDQLMKTRSHIPNIKGSIIIRVLLKINYPIVRVPSLARTL